MKSEEILTSIGVTVDYSLSLSQMIRAGKYDKVHKDITGRNFRLEDHGQRSIDAVLIQFRKGVASLEAVALMRNRGYRPAILEELLAIGSEYPDLQRQIPIVALGTGRMIQNRRYVPCLCGSPSTRELSLVVIYRRWSIYYRFAFVKK